MQGHPEVITALQAQLKNELTAINQYFLHYRMLKQWGLDKLAKKEYEESIGKMKHADQPWIASSCSMVYRIYKIWASCAWARPRLRFCNVI